MKIIAAADGSALGNPGPAGWGWYCDSEHWACGGWPHGTNNMGELGGVLDLLQQTAHLDAELHILCDSTYVINSITKWMKGWKKKGWKKSDGKPVLNVELMKAIDAAMQGRDVTFEWVKGHAGHHLNEEADRLANGAATAFQQGREPDPGPGFPGAETAHPDARVSQTQEEPDLFSELSAAEVATSSPVRTAAAVDQVIEREWELLDDAVRSDPAAVAALLHPDWTEIGGSGRVWSREEMLAEIGPLGEAQLEVISADQINVDTVLLVWRCLVDGACTLRSSVWVRQSGRWLQRFHQGTLEA